ncbi:hypothetical protein AT959_09755 [Dechloromonas denitrificans]|uniref:Uncharacterized protein n=1 Tax=Dechloromonas denitrificans TaxID=281362 RepID=A0A133XJ57_9RHOO|nr:hypothetical protein AT959_09755 [Dechloromonas denitrificans]
MRLVGAGRSQVDDRAEIEIDAERRQALPLPSAVAAGASGGVAGADQAGQRRQGFEQWRQVRDRAAFLVAGDDQRRQFGPLADGLQFGDLGRHFGQRPAAQVAPGQVDAADQAVRRQLADFGEVAVADDEMPAHRLHRRAAGQHGGPLVLVFAFAAQRHDEHRQQQDDRQAPRPAPAPEQAADGEAEQ